MHFYLTISFHRYMLAEPARDELLRQLHLWHYKNLISVAGFDKATEVKIGDALLHAGGLLHVVRDNDDRVAVTQLIDQFFQDRGGDRIERRCRFVH